MKLTATELVQLDRQLATAPGPKPAPGEPGSRELPLSCAALIAARGAELRRADG